MGGSSIVGCGYGYRDVAGSCYEEGLFGACGYIKVSIAAQAYRRRYLIIGSYVLH